MTGDLEVFALRMGMIAVLLGFVALVARWLRDSLRSPGATVMPRAGVEARLVVIAPGRSGLEPGAVLPVTRRLSVGRSEGNGLVLADPSVSARHAVLERRDGAWYVRDLGSTNGTLLDGHPVGGRPRRLHHGARLRFGAVVFEFREEGASAARFPGDAQQQAEEGEVHHQAGAAVAHERERYSGGGDEA